MQTFIICFVDFLLLVLAFSECTFEMRSRGVDLYFDLSPLASVPYEEIEFRHEGIFYLMYLSLCKPASDLPVSFLKNSTVNARALILKRNGTHVQPFVGNAGDHVKKVEFSDGSLAITLVSNDSCQEFDRKHSNYSVVIKFKTGPEHNKAVFQSFNKDICQFVLEWETNMAAPLGSHNVWMDNCFFRYKNHIFDLTPLKRAFYQETKSLVKNHKAFINFCRPLTLDGCSSNQSSLASLCIQSENASYSFNQVGHAYEESEGKLQINFENSHSLVNGKKSAWSALVILICDKNSFGFIPELKKRKKLMVMIKTYLTCLPEKCSVLDNNYRYNLPNVANYKIKHEESVFLLSTCGPLKTDLFYLGGKSVAALINETAKSLGFMRTLKIDPGDSSVRLILTGGFPCGEKQVRVKTTVLFVCSQMDSGLFFKNFSNCEFFFQWETPTVCPVLFAEAGRCSILDPSADVVFNLSNDLNEVDVVHSSGLGFRINLCSDATQLCDSKRDYSICFFKNKGEIVLGRRSSQILKLFGNLLFFELHGDECATGVSSKVYVTLICDPEGSDSAAPVLREMDLSRCIFNFTIATKKVCYRNVVMPCSVKNSLGQIADLSALRKNSSNYRIDVNETAYYVINVCGSLWHSRREPCSLDSGACLINLSKSSNLGYVNEGLRLKGNDDIFIQYDIDLLCETNASMKKGTTLTFKCGQGIGHPEYMGYKNCNHNFLWKTRYACFNGTHEEIMSSTPVVETTRPNHFHFNNDVNEISTCADSLKTQEVELPGKERTFFQFEKILHLMALDQRKVAINENMILYLHMYETVAVEKPICGTDLSCLILGSGKIIGLGSQFKLSVEESSRDIILEHHDGSECDQISGVRYSSRYRFTCNKDGGTGNPKLSSRTDCTFTFEWVTSVVCDLDLVAFDKNSFTVRDDVLGAFSVASIYKRSVEISHDEEITINKCEGNADVDSCHWDTCIKRGSSVMTAGSIQNIGFYNWNLSVSLLIIGGCDKDYNKSLSTYLLLKCASESNNSSKDSNDSWTVMVHRGIVILQGASSDFCFRPVETAKHFVNVFVIWSRTYTAGFRGFPISSSGDSVIPYEVIGSDQGSLAITIFCGATLWIYRTRCRKLYMPLHIVGSRDSPVITYRDKKL